MTFQHKIKSNKGLLFKQVKNNFFGGLKSGVKKIIPIF